MLYNKQLINPGGLMSPITWVLMTLAMLSTAYLLLHIPAIYYHNRKFSEHPIDGIKAPAYMIPIVLWVATAVSHFLTNS